MEITVHPHRIDSYPDKFEFYLKKDGLDVGKLFGVDKSFVDLIASAPTLLSERDELKAWKQESEIKLLEAGQALGVLSSERDKLKKEVERLKELKNLLWYFPECFDSDPDDAIRYVEITNKAIAIEKELAESLLKK